MTSQRQTALITGASGGIGFELARVFAEEGFDLVAVARRTEALEALAARCRDEFGARVSVRAIDLVAPGAVDELVHGIEKEGIEIDVLVNNAGVMDMGSFAKIDAARHDRLVQLNIGVLVSLTRRLLPGMMRRRRGRILNVASTSAFQPIPSMATYAASKAFVLSLSESLSEELRGTGVTVTALCPGFTKTEMLDRAKDEHTAANEIPDLFVSDATEVAREGFRACMDGTVVVVPGRPNQLLASSVGFYPRWLVRGVTGLFGRRAID